MRKTYWFVLGVVILGLVSCATTKTQESQAEEIQQEAEVKELVDTLTMGDAAPIGINSTMPTSDAFHTDYLEFGPNATQVIVSVPNNTNQEIDAIIWLCDNSTLGTKVFDLGTYPASYKEKYIIAIMPYEFKDGKVQVKNVRGSVGDIVDLVNSITKEHGIEPRRTILVCYTIGYFSMAFL
jgi:hypothetical protein